MTFICKIGLFDWIKEAIGFGANLLDSNKKLYNNDTIFVYCLESNDYEMLSFIFFLSNLLMKDSMIYYQIYFVNQL